MANGMITAGAGLTDKINRLKDFISERKIGQREGYIDPTTRSGYSYGGVGTYEKPYGSPDAGLGSTASMLGMSQADLDKHFDEWYEYAIKPEISSSEYHRRGGELLSADSREGWHSKVPLGQFVLPALALGYQLPQEVVRGLKQNTGFSLGSALFGLGKGLYTGVKDAVHNIQGMARAGQFDERFYQESGEGYKKGLGDDFVPHPQTSGANSRELSVEDILGKEPSSPEPPKKYTVEPYLGDRSGRKPKPADPFAFEDVKARATRPAASTPAAVTKDISFLLQNTPSATPVRRRSGGRPTRRGFIPPTRGGHHGR